MAGGIDGLQLGSTARHRCDRTVSMMLAPGWREMIMRRPMGLALIEYRRCAISSTESCHIGRHHATRTGASSAVGDDERAIIDRVKSWSFAIHGQVRCAGCSASMALGLTLALAAPERSAYFLHEPMPYLFSASGIQLAPAPRAGNCQPTDMYLADAGPPARSFCARTVEAAS